MRRSESWVIKGGDGLYLSVPVNGQKPVGELLDEILGHGIVDLTLRKLVQLLRTNRGKTVRMAERVKAFNRDDIEVTLTEDRMVAYLKVDSRERPVLFLELVAALRTHGVTSGIDYRKLDDLAAREVAVFENELVAGGTPARDGQDATLDFFFDPEESLTPLTREDGSVDFRQIDVIKTINRDAVLVKRTPPTSGTPGIDVTGRTIPPKKGEDKKLPVGSRTYIDKTGTELRAAVPGRVYLNNEKVHIEEMCVIKANVDFSVGNVDFRGDVFVQGNVLPDFVVKAKGNIEINGNVEGGHVHSEEGNVSIKGDIVGRGRSVIEAAGELAARSATEATLKAGDTIRVKEYIANCEVTAERMVDVAEGRGILVGGKARAGFRMVVKNAGSTASNRTDLFICERGVKAIKARLESLKEEMTQLKSRLKKAESSEIQLRLLGEKIWDLPEMRRNTLRSEAYSLTEVNRKIKIITELMEQTKKDLEEEESIGLDVKERVFPGVRVHIGGVSRCLDRLLKQVKFRLEEEYVVDHPLSVERME